MHASTAPSRDPVALPPSSFVAPVSDAAPPHSVSMVSRQHTATLPMPLHHRPTPPPLAFASSLSCSQQADVDRQPSSQQVTYASHVMPRLPTLGTTVPHGYVSEPSHFNRRFAPPSTRRVAIDSLLDARTHVDNMQASQSLLPPIQSRVAPMRDTANMYNSQRNNMYQRSMRPGQENRIQRRRAVTRMIPCPYENCEKTFSRNSNLKGTFCSNGSCVSDMHLLPVKLN
ncbi:hypothetical protein FGB62_13g222 [Gracilaria domingensis]|nr:hypothetical protein FGB62_13g222 [Gracilaria domingensis]